jgi:hypothetical protein
VHKLRRTSKASSVPVEKKSTRIASAGTKVLMPLMHTLINGAVKLAIVLQLGAILNQP